MPDPTYRNDPDFPSAVARKLRQLAEFEEAAFGLPAPSLGDVHRALLDLKMELSLLRQALHPDASLLVHGDAAVREFKRLQEVQ